MTGLLAACLVAGAVTMLWPAGTARRRLLAARRGSDAAARAASVPWRLPRKLVTSSPRRLLVGAIVAVALMALIAGGPVAGVVGAVYSALAGRALLRYAAHKGAAAEHLAALDGLAALAADLRAGLVVAAADLRAAAPVPAAGAGRIAGLTAAVWRLAERTGAPAADLVERIEADARQAERAARSAAAQAAGAQVTALLLAGLPLAGLGLGAAIGADPVRVLLHTRLGAACAIVAVLLQAGGLLWADRLAAGVAR